MADTPPPKQIDPAATAEQPRWENVLAAYRIRRDALFGDELIARWGAETWAPCEQDKQAAAKLHMEINSRITTQRLGYLDGVEQRALDSIYTLFQRTRDICLEHPLARHFDALAWHVLNTHVRPFTARWHRASQAGALKALDATDEFRAELAALQPVLRCFDDLLLHVRDGLRPAPVKEEAQSASKIAKEMVQPVAWGIPKTTGGIDEKYAKAINAFERSAIELRREEYGTRKFEPDAVGLALSGGGIRSATFSLGVLIALAGRGLLPQFDYLSTVSGGGYLGSFLSAFLNSEHGENIGLKPDQLPFQREGGEAAALRHLRHHSKYLAMGSWWERIPMLLAQLYGMVLNGLAIVLIAVTVAAVERVLREWPALDGGLGPAIDVVIVALVLFAVVALVVLRLDRRAWRWADRLVAFPAMILVALLCWRGVGRLHGPVRAAMDADGRWPLWLVAAGVVLFVASAASRAGQRMKALGVVLVLLSILAVPLFLFGIYLAAYAWAQGPDVTLPFLGTLPREQVQWGSVALGWLLYHLLLDINLTSPHRHYRAKLAKAYLIQPSRKPKKGAASDFDTAVCLRLSALGEASGPHRAPYHLINCALNVPGSENSAMQGRLTDFFLFSPAFCGSPLLGYFPTAEWEARDRHLDLGTAMAISGAAAAPQMGLGTMTRLRFWLALLNVRLGYWVRNPDPDGKRGLGRPGLWYLLQEMLGIMDEKRPWVHVSDGGHIENLGVYELLRRRCKYIVAVDGEQDPQMTFQGFTRLQRLASIDLGVRIDVDLDDLRLNDQGLSRSHFRFCRIRYPSDGRGSPDEYGYLLYLKLSLTGNEGEFIRRYRHDEPAFPHHTTADQFFSEEQFEAYRSLGEHAGNNLFLRAIVGEELAVRTDLSVDAWFRALGENLLEPLRPPPAAA